MWPSNNFIFIFLLNHWWPADCLWLIRMLQKWLEARDVAQVFSTISLHNLRVIHQIANSAHCCTRMLFYVNCSARCYTFTRSRPFGMFLNAHRNRKYAKKSVIVFLPWVSYLSSPSCRTIRSMQSPVIYVLNADFCTTIIIVSVYIKLQLLESLSFKTLIIIWKVHTERKALRNLKWRVKFELSLLLMFHQNKIK